MREKLDIQQRRMNAHKERVGELRREVMKRMWMPSTPVKQEGKSYVPPNNLQGNGIEEYRRRLTGRPSILDMVKSIQEKQIKQAW